MPGKNEAASKLQQEQQQKQRIERLKEEKKRKKESKEQEERNKKLLQERAAADALVSPIYSSGLADAYKYFLQEAFREDVKFSIYEFAAQKLLKYQKMKKQKEKKLSQLADKLL